MRKAQLQIENGREAAYIDALGALSFGEFSGPSTKCPLCGYEGEIPFEAVRVTGLVYPLLERSCPRCKAFYYENPIGKMRNRHGCY